MTGGRAAEKAILRREMRERLRLRPAPEAAEASLGIREWLRPHVAAGTVAAFFPLPGEVDLVPLLAALAAEGRLVLPRVVDADLVLHRVHSLDALLPGPFGLREPAADFPLVRPDELSVVLVPGLAFTPNGERLGRGGGFYDRLLACVPSGVITVGVGFADQLVASLPTEPHDVRLVTVVPSGAAGPNRRVAG